MQRLLPRLLCLSLAALPFISEAAPLRVGMNAWVGFSPINVADAKGFWKEQGLDVQVVAIPGDGSSTDAFANGDTDISIDMLGTWVTVHQERANVVFLAETDWSNGGDKVIIDPKLDLAKGEVKRIGVYDAGAALSYFLSAFLQSRSLKYQDFEIVELDSEELSDHFIAGRLPLILNYDPNATRAVREGGGKVLATSADYPGSIPEGFAIRRERFAELPREDLVKFLRGWYRAVKWVQDPANWAEYQQILNTRTFAGEEPASEADLKEMVASVAFHNPAQALERHAADGGMVRYLQTMQEHLKSIGELHKEIVPEEVTVLEIAREAAAAEK